MSSANTQNSQFPENETDKPFYSSLFDTFSALVEAWPQVMAMFFLLAFTAGSCLGLLLMDLDGADAMAGLILVGLAAASPCLLCFSLLKALTAIISIRESIVDSEHAKNALYPSFSQHAALENSARLSMTAKPDYCLTYLRQIALMVNTDRQPLFSTYWHKRVSEGSLPKLFNSFLFVEHISIYLLISRDI